MLEIDVGFTQLLIWSSYLLYDGGQLFNQLYKILDKFYSSFGVRGLKIGDKKYSLSADGDNEVK